MQHQILKETRFTFALPWCVGQLSGHMGLAAGNSDRVTAGWGCRFRFPQQTDHLRGALKGLGGFLLEFDRLLGSGHRDLVGSCPTPRRIFRPC